MPARLLDGKALAEAEKRRIAERAGALRSAGRPVRLDAVLAHGGSDAASMVYADNQRKMCADLGIDYRLHELPVGCRAAEIAEQVERLNSDPNVHAVMVHMPLPAGVDAYGVQSLIAPEKDVEGVNPANIGNIVYGRVSLAPCTALAVLKMIDATGLELKGKFAVCVGASDIVGKPVAVMLMRREATVVSCTKFTEEITLLTRRADVLVAAAGSPGLIRRDWVREGAIVIDVGINRVTGADGKTRTVGDVAFDEVREVAGWITPVPGGVGPVTVVMLLDNVLASAERGGH
ncbi:MAG: bifunctional 5,10-methylenetetrahydrofolate dehydrogenase/5,10-methenyltetrahydrofolate cyclohydrolase [Phycisphaerae bacterium]|nr:bifunctional 5,10-methylenetetrahydrofolate dehydrogenase/5,10-methenyltetrahydrofolate cyclohydrolase [Phycisphaerae bacterium]